MSRGNRVIIGLTTNQENTEEPWDVDSLYWKSTAREVTSLGLKLQYSYAGSNDGYRKELSPTLLSIELLLYC